MQKKKMEEAMQEIIKEYSFIQFICATDTNGMQLTDNITQPYKKSEYDKQFPEKQNFSDRKWFKQPIQNGDLFATDLFTSKIDSSLCMTVSSLIVKDKEDELKGVLGVDVRFEDISKIEEYVFKVMEHEHIDG